MPVWSSRRRPGPRGQRSSCPSSRRATSTTTTSFSSSSRPVKDLFVRYSPGIQWTYRRPELTIDGRYLLDAEFYADQTQLDNYHARQLASVGVQSFKDRFTTLSACVTYAETLGPGDLVQATGLDLGRARSQAYSASLGLERRAGPSETLGLGYDFTLLMFAQEENVGSHLLTGTWSRKITPFTSIRVRAGPRFIQGDIDPELSASIDRRLDRGNLDLSYMHSRNPVPLHGDATRTDAVILTASRQIRQFLRVGVSPSMLRNRRGDATARVYRMSVSLDYQMTRWLSQQVSDRYSAQEGSTAASVPDQSIRHNILLISASIATQFRPQPSDWQTQPGEDQ